MKAIAWVTVKYRYHHLLVLMVDVVAGRRNHIHIRRDLDDVPGIASQENRIAQDSTDFA